MSAGARGRLQLPVFCCLLIARDPGAYKLMPTVPSAKAVTKNHRFPKRREGTQLTTWLTSRGQTHLAQNGLTGTLPWQMPSETCHISSDRIPFQFCTNPLRPLHRFSNDIIMTVKMSVTRQLGKECQLLTWGRSAHAGESPLF